MMAQRQHLFIIQLHKIGSAHSFDQKELESFVMTQHTNHQEYILMLRPVVHVHLLPSETCFHVICLPFLTKMIRKKITEWVQDFAFSVLNILCSFTYCRQSKVFLNIQSHLYKSEYFLNLSEPQPLCLLSYSKGHVEQPFKTYHVQQVTYQCFLWVITCALPCGNLSTCSQNILYSFSLFT